MVEGQFGGKWLLARNNFGIYFQPRPELKYTLVYNNNIKISNNMQIVERIP